jgi:hypothetical protein
MLSRRERRYLKCLRTILNEHEQFQPVIKKRKTREPTPTAKKIFEKSCQKSGGSQAPIAVCVTVTLPLKSTGTTLKKAPPSGEYIVLQAEKRAVMKTMACPRDRDSRRVE